MKTTDEIVRRVRIPTGFFESHGMFIAHNVRPKFLKEGLDTFRADIQLEPDEYTDNYEYVVYKWNFYGDE
jgi:hypothetical protein